MENILLTLVIVLLVLLLFMLGGAGYLAWRFIKNKEATESSSPDLTQEMDRLHPEIKKRMVEAQKMRSQLQLEATCHLHPREPSEGACAICDRYFCKSCLKTQGTLVFCKEHLALYLNSSWEEVLSVKSTPQDPERGVIVVESKKNLWEKDGLPSYVQTHYKINLDGDQIESWLTLFARAQESLDVKKRLSGLST